MKFASVLLLAGAGCVNARYTSYNQPMAPGNENFPNEAPGFQPELEKGYPTINIKYRFNTAKGDLTKLLADAEADAAFDAALEDAYLTLKQDAGGKAAFLKSDPTAAAIAGAGVAAANPYEDMSELFRGMQFSARPVVKSGSLIDPAAFETVSSCDRDLVGCPAGFSSEGGACAPTAAYRGPCQEAVDFSGMSSAAKSRWMSQCGAFWPCKSCTRNYSEACPVGWTSSGGKCYPGASYTGSCGATDFAEYNAAMLKSWSDSCGAFWPCA